ncbi:MAG: PLP-dependent aminotransferase family protein [Butyrivibrio sp.]|nr:PLP-dependent aminotransferase family protein [Muribaculum sp.]MCM1552375.1 PLP-dependent aminotransferase family protein [Butyrivibrio sp.]
MYDMTIRLQPNSDKCLYEQIYEHIRHEIWEGKLLSGERLPSTRSLAEYLQVARSTVDYAYDQLQSEGYIESKPYKGYFVCPMEEMLWLSDEERESVSAPKQDTSQQDLIAYDFAPHGIDMSGFPFSVWKRINKNILNDGNSELFARGEPQGDYELRLTISRYLHSSRGVNCEPEQIIVGAGNDYLLMLLEKILGRQVEIAMENPTYMRTWQIFQSFGYHVTTIPMDENGILVSALETTGARVAYVMPSHQFPTGTVMPIGRRMELLKWANRGGDRYLIEDDYDSEFRYRGKPIPSLQASDEKGKVIYIGTFSKAIAPAIRVSYMVLPRTLLEVYRRDCYFYSCTVSRIDQRVLNEFIRDGYFERHLNKMRKLYRAKHDLLLQELAPFEGGFEVSGEHGGLHLLLTARSDVTEVSLIRRAAEKRVRVYGMSDSCVEPLEGRATVLLGFGAMEENAIRQGVGKLKEAWL